ncbi:MAG: hypothetical protein U5L09_20620 [Bacteroidales bacterium]|nr:hypothetical protein [Bacteroidales bacterium]
MSICLNTIWVPSNDTIAPEREEQKTREVIWHEVAGTGKMDLVVDLNFRMGSLGALFRYCIAGSIMV